MKLIQIDNTLYIVEGENKYKVSEESYSLIGIISCGLYEGSVTHPSIKGYKSFIKEGVDITDIEHRLIRYNTDIGNGEIEMQWHLLPEKKLEREDYRWQDMSPEEVKAEASPSLSVKYKNSLDKLYSIEQIEKAIEDIAFKEMFVDVIKRQVIKNLKNPKI